MTLGFSTQIEKKPTYFVEKIWESILSKGVEINANDFIEYGRRNLPKNYIIGTHKSKIHTIREDKKDRWKVGNKIHFVIYNRTPARRQFAPVVKCESIQKIEITHSAEKWRQPWVSVSNSLLTGPEIEELAVNDGFESSKEFFEYFNENFSGKIIHWTDLKY